MFRELSRFREVSGQASCRDCHRDFIVTFASLYMKVFPWTGWVKFCPFCGNEIDHKAIAAGTPIPVEHS